MKFPEPASHGTMEVQGVWCGRIDHFAHWVSRNLLFCALDRALVLNCVCFALNLYVGRFLLLVTVMRCYDSGSLCEYLIGEYL